MATLPEFDELNTIRTRLYEATTALVTELSLPSGGQQARKRCEDMIFDLITMGYAYGIAVAGLSLDEDIPIDSRRMFEVAWEKTKGETFEDRINAHIDAAKAALASEAPETVANRLNEELSVVAETETHRAGNEAVIDGGEWYGDKTGKQVWKRWQTMEDDRVRDPHWLLEGAEVPLDAYFYTDGDKALFPGGFDRADLNVNCRCWTTLVPIE